MQNILVVSGHTDLNNSVANKAILERLENKLPQAEFVYLDKLYSDFQIDVEAEQEKLLNADIIVLSLKSYCSRKVLMIVGAIYHQIGNPK